MMRVLVVSGNPYLASTTRPLDAALEILAQADIEPYFVFTRSGPWQQELASQGHPVVVRNLPWPCKKRVVASAWDISWLASYLITHGIDFIHCNEHEHYPAIRHAAKWAGKPVLVTLHYNLEGGFARWAFAPPYMPRVLQFLSRAQWEVSRPELPSRCHTGAIYITGSGLSVRKLRASFTGRDLRKELGIDRSKVVIGTAGALRPRKRLEDFIRLMATLKRLGLPVVGLIAGGGTSVDKPYYAMLRQLVRDFEVEDVCRFLGFIYPCTDFYKSLDIYIHTASMEIFCMSICEAQALGIPCLVYNVGGNAEAVPDEQSLIPFGCLDELAKRTEILVRDQGLRLGRGKLARDFIERTCDAAVYAAKVRRLYSYMMQESPILV